MKRCPACQQGIPADAKFCGFCGFRLGPIERAARSDAADAAPRPKLRILGSSEAGGEKRPDVGPSRVPSTNAEALASTDEKRREFQRFPLKVEVDYRSAHNFFTGFTQNISSGGLFVATYTPGELGADVEVTFTVPGLNEPCVARCEVVWVRDHDPMSPDMVPGMGLRFVDLADPASEAIGLFIQHREPIFFED